VNLVVHPHFHNRYTGATRHVEAVVPALNLLVETKVMGPTVSAELPHLAWKELWGAARQKQMVFHAHRVNELLVGMFVRWVGKDVRLAFTRHSVGRPSWLTRLLAARANVCVSLTPEVADTLGLPSVIVGHGVDLDRFQVPADRARAWQALGVGGRYGMGVVGRLRKDKGQADFVEAVAPLLQPYPEWRAVLAGLAKPSEEGWVKGLVEQGGPSLSWVGEKSDIERWYRGFTVVVNPSHQESFGLARAEALASGCCLVTTRLNAFDAALEHGRNAFLYEKGDVKALRAILEELMRNPTRAGQVGQQGAEFARSQLGIRHEAEALLQVYRTLDWRDRKTPP
jgi:mannosyltransferase